MKKNAYEDFINKVEINRIFRIKLKNGTLIYAYKDNNGDILRTSFRRVDTKEHSRRIENDEIIECYDLTDEL